MGLQGEYSECFDCPMLFQTTDGEDKCSLEFAGPMDDCTRAGIAHKLDGENADLRRQLKRWKLKAELQADLLVCYRIGKRPSGRVLDGLAKIREQEEAAGES